MSRGQNGRVGRGEGRGRCMRKRDGNRQGNRVGRGCGRGKIDR